MRLPRFLAAIATQIALVVVLLGLGLLVHVYRTEPRPARTLVERELRGGLLAPDEHVERIAAVFQRRAGDYLRATRGIVALTDRRLIYVGLAPRDILGPEESAPAFESREFALDTSTRIGAGRAMLGAAHAIVLQQHGKREVFAVGGDAWPDARAIISTIGAHHDAQRTEAARNRRAQQLADSIARAPNWHVVGRGEALSTIATMYNTTPEELRTLNSLTSDKIRIGQRLLVKPQT